MGIVAVTGSSGYIGTRLLRQMEEDLARVFAGGAKPSPSQTAGWVPLCGTPYRRVAIESMAIVSRCARLLHSFQNRLAFRTAWS